MRRRYEEKLIIPEGIDCEIADGKIKCSKGDVVLEKNLSLIGTEATVQGGEVKFLCKKANKKNISVIKTYTAHLRNLFDGLENKFVYTLEICNVHFPITVKVEGQNILISNFLGEKVNRTAKILDSVEVNVKGNKIEVSSHDIEKAGQTAANLEKATKVGKRDRRVFQDGIFITSKPSGEDKDE